MPEQTPVTSDLLIEWDTVFAIRYPQVNRGIAQGGRTPLDFYQEVPDDDGNFTLKGDFLPWMVVPKGKGHLVRMRLPVPGMVFQDPGGSPKTFVEGYFEIEVPLKTVMRDGAERAPDDGDLVDFRVDGPTARGARVTVHDLVFDPQPEGEEADFIKIIFESWLNLHLDDFDHVFCTININRNVDEDHLKWIQPTHASYAVVDDQENMDSGVFGILCMTEGRNPPKDQLIDSKAIPPGVPSAFLMSKERFLTKMLIGQIGTMFSGPAKDNPSLSWPEDYFKLSENDTIIENVEDVRIDKVLIGTDDPQEYTCYLGARDLQISISETLMNVRITKLTHNYLRRFMTWWLNVEHTMDNDYVLHLDPDTQNIWLTPPLKPGSAKEVKVGSHKVEIFKTETAKKIDMILTIVGIVLAFAPMIGRCAGWLRAVAGAASETGDAALLETELLAVGEGSLGQLEELTAVGAGEELVFVNGEAINLSNASNAWRTLYYATMAAAWGGKLFGDVLAAMADKDQEGIPRYSEFLAGVLAPITWPATGTGYRLYDVRLTDSFQTLGEWQAPADQT